MIVSAENLIPLAIFLAFSLGAWAVLGLLAERSSSAEDRLQRLLDPRTIVNNQAKRQEAVQARLTAAANKLGQSLRPADTKELGKIRIKLMNAGFRHEQAVAVFFGAKLIGLLVGLLDLCNHGFRGRRRLLFRRFHRRQAHEVAWHGHLSWFA
jgi:tight adherence protein C